MIFLVFICLFFLLSRAPTTFRLDRKQRVLRRSQQITEMQSIWLAAVLLVICPSHKRETGETTDTVNNKKKKKKKEKKRDKKNLYGQGIVVTNAQKHPGRKKERERRRPQSASWRDIEKRERERERPLSSLVRSAYQNFIMQKPPANYDKRHSFSSSSSFPAIPLCVPPFIIWFSLSSLVRVVFKMQLHHFPTWHCCIVVYICCCFGIVKEDSRFALETKSKTHSLFGFFLFSFISLYPHCWRMSRKAHLELLPLRLDWWSSGRKGNKTLSRNSQGLCRIGTKKGLFSLLRAIGAGWQWNRYGTQTDLHDVVVPREKRKDGYGHESSAGRDKDIGEGHKRPSDEKDDRNNRTEPKRVCCFFNDFISTWLLAREWWLFIALCIREVSFPLRIVIVHKGRILRLSGRDLELSSGERWKKSPPPNRNKQ